jgi:hypothetical protein
MIDDRLALRASGSADISHSRLTLAAQEYILVIVLFALAGYTEYDKWTRRC